MQIEISSPQNPLVKRLVQLKEKSRERRKSGLFVIEGQREISLALKANYQIDTILICAELLLASYIEQFQNEGIKTITISKEVYQKIAHRSTTEGILALAKSKSHELKDLQLKSEKPLIVIAEAPEKPGNIGALLRTADAAKVDAVIIANPKTDLYNPNIIRSSVGCVFTNQIAFGTVDEIIHYLKANDINIYCAALQSSKPYHEIDFTKPTALVVGTESTGLSDEWLANSTQNIIIPMSGQIDSMNVSVAAGILIFEAKRQRNFL